ncbi:MAG: hypothetical protein SCALA702_26030 [Melioribacteraceae bacterium]|nr:MAG: hypothetical protein SCALA702_26030 [Melioribacteraceae bacterium]
MPWREGCAAANLSWITEENQKNFCHSREGGNPDFFHIVNIPNHPPTVLLERKNKTGFQIIRRGKAE